MQNHSFVQRWLGRLSLILMIGVGVLAYRERAAIARWFIPPVPSEDGAERKLASFTDDTKTAFLVNEDAVKSTGIEWSQVKKVDEPIRLDLTGKLFLDPNRLVGVHARFAGEIVELGRNTSASPGEADPGVLRFGDHVEQGQLLAVLWSKEVGDEKSDLVDSISKLRLDEQTFLRLKELEPTGAVAERIVREAQRSFEADKIDVSRAERTLRSWRFSEEAIAVVKAEAERLHSHPESKDTEVERRWAEVNVVSPISGLILEHNAPIGDVVDAGDILFKIADLDRIGVVVNLYEDDLPSVLSIQEAQRKMHIRVANDPTGEEFEVAVANIGDVIDPNQHTVAVIGWIDNVDRRLRSGQFVIARIDLPPAEGQVTVPTSAVIDKGRTGTVFVSPPESSKEFRPHTVSIIRRTAREVWIRSEPSEQQAREGMEPLLPGSRVVSSGVLTLSGILSELSEEDAASTSPPSVEGVRSP